MFSKAGDSKSQFFIGFLKETNDCSDSRHVPGDKVAQLGDKGSSNREAAQSLWKQPYGGSTGSGHVQIQFQLQADFVDGVLETSNFAAEFGKCDPGNEVRIVLRDVSQKRP